MPDLQCLSPLSVSCASGRRCAGLVGPAGADRLRQGRGAAAGAGGARQPPPEVGVVGGHAGRRRPRDRAAGPPRGLARGAGARPRRRHRAEAPVPRRQRREGRPAAVPHRPRALRGRRAERRRPAWRAPQANAGQAKALAERYKPLVEANAISKQEYANAVAAAEGGRGRRRRGPRGACRPPSINLGYATVTAPISGRIGRALVTEGALVGQGEATQLAVIQQINPMYVNFTQSASDVLKLRRALEAGQFKRASGAEARQRARGAGGRQRVSAARQAAVLRPDGRSDHRPGHAARRGAQPQGRRCCPACTCACGSSRRRPATPSRCRSRP